MAEIPAALRLTKATFALGSDSYTQHIASYEFTPNTPTTTFTDISGTVHKFAADEADWTLNLSLGQDFSATGLAKYMLDHAGDDVEVTIVDGPATWTATVTCLPPNIGGAGASINQSRLALPSTEPEWEATTP